MLSLLLNGIRNGNLDFGSVIAEILAVSRYYIFNSPVP